MPGLSGGSRVVLAIAALPAAALAQQANTAPVTTHLPRVEVVTPAALPGIGVARNRLPYTVESLDADAIGNENSATLPELMRLRMPGVGVGEIQGNPFQPDVNFRGFTASPLLGTPQGLSVFLDGVRINEAFGDIVNWDLIPQAALSDLVLMPGSNPLYGLNTLGGAIALQTKSGDTHPGGTIELLGGSFGRASAQFEAGRGFAEDMHVFASGTFFRESGWRDDSPSRVGQFFAKFGQRNASFDGFVSVLGADTDLIGNALVPQSFLAERRAGNFTLRDQTRNQLAMLTASGAWAITGGAQLSATLYLRRVHTRTLSGDMNAEFAGGPDDSAAGGSGVESDSAINHRTRTEQSSAGAALQWSVATEGHQIALGGAVDASRSGFSQGGTLGVFDSRRAVIETGAFETENALTGQVGNLGVFATDTVALVPDLYVTLSGRYNVSRLRMRDTGPSAPALDGDHRFSKFNPALGAAYEWTPALTLYGGFAQGSRAPSPIELGCADPARPCTLPNSLASDPPLQQVVTQTYELGMRGKLAEGVRWNAGLFQSTNRNDILFVGTTASAGYFTNFGKTQRRGLELGASGKSGALDWGASYSYVRAGFASSACIASPSNSTRGTFSRCSPGDPANPGATLGSDLIAVAPGNRMPGIPEQSLKLNASLALGDGWRIGAQWVAVSSVFVRGNENNRHASGTYADLNGVSRAYLGPGEAGGYGVLNLSARYAVSTDFEFYGRLANVFNQQYATAGALAENPFDATGTFRTDSGLWTHETFFAPGAPRAAWIGLRSRF